MFNIDMTPSFRREVQIAVPDGDDLRTDTLRATFNVVPQGEEDVFEVETVEGTIKFLRHVLVAVDDVVDEKGAPVPYSDALRERLLALPFVRSALLRAYYEGSYGAKLGN